MYLLWLVCLKCPAMMMIEDVLVVLQTKFLRCFEGMSFICVSFINECAHQEAEVAEQARESRNLIVNPSCVPALKRISAH